jgi:GNAT superfamily N-acetyltransferase
VTAGSAWNKYTPLRQPSYPPAENGRSIERLMTYSPDVATTSEPMRFSPFTPAEADEMTRVLAEAFTKGDPPAIAVGLTLPEFEALVRLFCPKAAAESLTIVARSVETGEMCGALLAEDSASTPPAGIVELSEKFDPIFDILSELYDEYRPESVPPPGESMHLFLLGVAPKYAGKGIAKRLVTECLANGVRKGYRVAVTEATSRTSQHVFREQGFVARVHGSYADHRFDGRAVFASIAGHGGPILMDKQW